jgi:hypothetical protein
MELLGHSTETKIVAVIVARVLSFRSGRHTWVAVCLPREDSAKLSVCWLASRQALARTMGPSLARPSYLGCSPCLSIPRPFVVFKADGRTVMSLLRNKVALRRIAAGAVLACPSLAMLDVSSAQARALGIRINTPNAVSTCSPSCVITRHGGLVCPQFLTTPDHWPCADYKMTWTPCGWQLDRVFMCR